MYCRFFLLKNERFAHSLIFGEQIALAAHQNWAMWANCSGRSPKMRDHEQFTQVACQKWLTMSESLRSLTKNEQMSKSLVFLSESLIRSFFAKPMSEFPALNNTVQNSVFKVRSTACSVNAAWLKLWPEGRIHQTGDIVLTSQCSLWTVGFHE